MLKLSDIENNLISKYLTIKKKVDVDYLISREYSLFELFAIITLRNDLVRLNVLMPKDYQVLHVKYKKKNIDVYNYQIELKGGE